MFDLFGIRTSVALSGLIVAMALVLAAMLSRASWRNHFRMHRMRPAVFSTALVCWGLFLRFGLTFLAQLSTTEHLSIGMKLLNGGYGDIINLYLAGALAFWTATLVIVYPDTRDRRQSPESDSYPTELNRRK